MHLPRTPLVVAFVPVLAMSPIQAADPWEPDPAVVENASANSEFNYREDAIPPYSLPDVLGEAQSRDAWESSRRGELIELFREHVYGRRPDAPLDDLAFEVKRTDPAALDGKATLKEVAITCTKDGESLVIDLVLFTPNDAAEPAPAFLLINNRDPENIDPNSEEDNGFWPVATIVARGYAAAAFNNRDVDPDKHDGFKDGVHGLFEDSSERTPHSWGTLSAWGWGASRCLDYLETEAGVDAAKVAVIGHSRGGKTALWAAVEDDRFAMAVSNESGCGGAALSRRKFGETVARITSSFPHWFCGKFAEYGGNEDALPVDQHQLIALLAPRAAYVASAAEDLWADPRGEFLALAHASPAFALYGLDTLAPDPMPALDSPVSAGHQGYHIRPGKHGLTPADWERYLDFADDAVVKNPGSPQD
ncbi:acetylxylan esterase [soil metagenome]